MANGAKKVAVIGAGNVGATCAFVLAERKVGEVVLLAVSYTHLRAHET